MKIEVTTTAPHDRQLLELTLNGRTHTIQHDLDLADSTDETIAAFFAGYSVGTADEMAQLAKHDHSHDHDHGHD